MFLLECVKWHCMCILVGSSPGTKYSLLGIAHPVVGPPFRYTVDIGEWLSDKVVIMKKADIWP